MNKGLVVKGHRLQIIAEVHFFLTANLHHKHAQGENIGLGSHMARVKQFALLQQFW